MLRGRQLRLIRLDKDIKQSTVAEKLNTTINMIKIYEYEIKPIPEDLYKAWIDLIC